jgi:thiol-disulfide isomerase/thioredoxin
MSINRFILFVFFENYSMRRFFLCFLFGLLLTSSCLVLAADKAQVNFELKDTAGVKHQLSNYKGKWVLVNYWATWCPPCLEEVPDLVNLYDHRRKKDLMVIGVVFDYKNTKEVTDYVDDMLMSYPIVLGDDEVATQIGTAEVLPTTYIYNPQGELVKIKRGLITKQYIEKIIGAGK